MRPDSPFVVHPEPKVGRLAHAALEAKKTRCVACGVPHFPPNQVFQDAHYLCANCFAEVYFGRIAQQLAHQRAIKANRPQTGWYRLPSRDIAIAWRGRRVLVLGERWVYWRVFLGLWVRRLWGGLLR